MAARSHLSALATSVAQTNAALQTAPASTVDMGQARSTRVPALEVRFHTDGRDRPSTRRWATCSSVTQHLEDPIDPAHTLVRPELCHLAQELGDERHDEGHQRLGIQWHQGSVAAWLLDGASRGAWLRHRRRFVWILVIEIFGGYRVEGSRTRGLTEATCLTLVQEVRSRTTVAYCYEDGQPDPGWGKPLIKRAPICDECGPLQGGGGCEWNPSR